MVFNIMTLFPDIINAYVNQSIIKNAIENELIQVNVHNIRDYSANKHKKVDDYPYGGGGGMIMTVQPIYDCYVNIKKNNPSTKLIYFSPKGKVLNNKLSYEYAKYDNITLLCGHYEGIDERIIDMIVDEEISIGDYVLTGGELPALVFLDTVSRKIDGVLSSQDNVQDESFEDGMLEYPQYTRPVEFNGMKVPDVLLSGNHQNIYKWRKEQSLEITKKRRPDLMKF
ncbi:MAG: tRNA (guanosine(37)-N1)-methyltransferase TrmD [Peptoanaerobacter stomatis]